MTPSWEKIFCSVYLNKNYLVMTYFLFFVHLDSHLGVTQSCYALHILYREKRVHSRKPLLIICYIHFKNVVKALFSPFFSEFYLILPHFTISPFSTSSTCWLKLRSLNLFISLNVWFFIRVSFLTFYK